MIDMNSILKPIRIVLDVTRRCNLHCWYCHSSSGPSYDGPEIDSSSLPEIFRAAEDNHVFDITITGGEPILWSGLQTAMDISCELKYTSLQLITNATIIDDRIVKILSSGNLKRVCVSLDGIELIHDKNRGKGTYIRAMHGIRNLLRVVDNLTVISVIDSSTALSWPELTYDLMELGVTQHHLAPVCFAGGAMNGYRGIALEQFRSIREMVDKISAIMPENFQLVFNDALVMGVQNRTLNIHTLTEVFKGWHVVVRPDGDVKMAINAWGRTWRDNEVLGNVNECSLGRILLKYKETVSDALQGQFSPQEERQRKFHLGTTRKNIAQDIRDIMEADSIRKKRRRPHTIKESSVVHLDKLPLGADIEDLSSKFAAHPERYRVRQENDFFMLFDTVSFELFLLTPEEMRGIIV